MEARGVWLGQLAKKMGSGEDVFEKPVKCFLSSFGWSIYKLGPDRVEPSLVTRGFRLQPEVVMNGTAGPVRLDRAIIDALDTRCAPRTGSVGQ